MATTVLGTNKLLLSNTPLPLYRLIPQESVQDVDPFLPLPTVESSTMPTSRVPVRAMIG